MYKNQKKYTVNIPSPFYLTNVEAEIFFVKNKKPIYAFVNLHFLNESDEIALIVRGYKITEMTDRHGNKYIKLDAPAYGDGEGYNKAFIINDGEVWEFIETRVLKEFYSRVDIEEIKGRWI